MKLDEYGVYCIYLSINMHYNVDSYNALKYNFKVRAKQQTFWKRKDRYFFYRIGQKLNWDREEIINYFNAYFSGGVNWLGDMLENDPVWVEYQKKMQSLNYIFENDIYNLHDDIEDFNVLFEIKEGAHPPIIQKLLQGDICIETIVVLNKMLGFIPKLKITETIVWPDLKKRILNYSQMIDQRINTATCKKITLDVWNS